MNHPIKHSRREIFSEPCQIKPKPDWIYHVPTDLERNGLLFGLEQSSNVIRTIGPNDFPLYYIQHREKRIVTCS